MTETDFADSLNGERCALSARWDVGAAGQRRYENEIIFVALHKLIEKFSAKKTKFFLTYVVRTAILTERLTREGAYYARKREIARVSEVTFVEYVRCRKHIRHAIGRLKPVFVHAYIACTGFDRPSGRFCFSVTA